MDIAVVTGSAGLVGGEAVRRFASRFDLVVGIDDEPRQEFSGPAGAVAEARRVPNYRHHRVDVRDQAAVDEVLRVWGADVRLVVHTAGQPSSAWSAERPSIDFGINAVGAVTVLDSVRRHCGEAVFTLVSTTEVYGDAPDALPLVETATRWELDPSHRFHEHGVDESIRLDRAGRTFLGVSKLAADLVAQEHGRQLGMKVGVFRCGSVTGTGQTGVRGHGFVSHLVRSAVRRVPYPVVGHGGKQVRDVLDARDLVDALWQFYLDPRPGEVYHLGGGRERGASVLELIARYEHLTGAEVPFDYSPQPRFADPRWWIGDTRKFRRDYPRWSPAHDLDDVLLALHRHWSEADEVVA
ncbi:NAD-dependent epimerase/dehydratase family protein [Lentzea jiangxiensis]|uniref:CDP-paratose 2-epimerase n=1 Tax=Lentzea jiangxiensis TaxID=641025 RepID=A0A1H0WTG2_9PSEU|nr:NAD-dependent epimerase/dehydratase family protein [Lentzea jiangxiensis]SDP93516.1 CDP-paratose 2-epimerase [Lentzea jiangxiensis]